MDDEGDFKKARGFLLTYSVLVLALWYFGANLTQFKLMGNEIQLHQRTSSAWLVLAIVNVYFLVRCYQRVPPLGLYFDEPMNDLYDKTLVWVVAKLKRRDVNRQAQEHFSANYKSTLEMQITSTTVEATARRTVNADQRNNGDEAPELHKLQSSTRAAVTVHATYAVCEENVWKHYAGYGRVVYEPSALLTWPLKAFVIARGALITPWFTDHIAPLALGVVTTVLALWKWCDLNFFATQISGAALLCI
jgi:hypothetical protein